MTAQVGHALDEQDEFGLLPTGAPTCVFESTITRVVEGSPVVLHKSKHSASDERGFPDAIKKGCEKCVVDLGKAAKELRDKKQIFFFQDKCFFVRCSYGKSESPVEISAATFSEKLVAKNEAFYCIRR